MESAVARNTVFAALVTAAAVGCASAGGPHRNSCELLSADSVYLAGQPLYRDCAVDERARLRTSNVTPDFRPSGDRSCYSAVIQFVVDSTGTPEEATARVIQSNSTQFADAMLRMIPQLSYRPARKNGIPVRQIVQERRSVALVAARVGSGPALPPRPGC